MDNDSINLMLGWFPYLESEKTQLRDLLTRRDPIVMNALSTFLQTKDVSGLNKEFKNALLMQEGGNVKSYIVHQEVINQPISSTYQYQSYSVPSNVVYQTTSYSSSYAPKTVENASYYTKDLKVISNDGEKIEKNQNIIGSPTRFSVKIVENLKNPVSKMIFQHLLDSNDEIKKKKSKVSILHDIEFEYLKEYEKTKILTPEMKKNLMMDGEKIGFEDFLDFRHFLSMTKIHFESFVEKFKRRVAEIHPPSKGQSGGLTLEEFILLLCGKADVEYKKIGYIGLMFNYLDYDNNGTLELDELILGLICLGPGDELEKIKLGFISFDRDGSLTLDENELVNYLEIIIRINKLNQKEADSVDNFEVQKYINLAALSLTKVLFDLIDTTNSKSIGVDEFLLWYKRVRYSPEDTLKLKDDESFMKSLAVVKDIKNKKNAFIKHDDKEIQNKQNEQLYKSLTTGNKGGKLAPILKDLKVNEIRVDTVVQVYKGFKGNVSALTIHDFHSFFLKICETDGVVIDKEKFMKNNIILFQILDTNKNGVLEWEEVLSAIIFNVKGAENEKIIASFNIYDTDNDLKLQFKELYLLLRGVFNVLLYSHGDNSNLKKENYEEVAFAMSIKCFQENKLDYKDKKAGINFADFRKWYTSIF